MLRHLSFLFVYSHLVHESLVHAKPQELINIVQYNNNTPLYTIRNAQLESLWSSKKSIIALELIREEGEWFYVRNLSTEIKNTTFPHSIDRLYLFKNYEIEWKMKKKDALWVLQKDISYPNQEGRKTWLLPGLLVHQQHDQWYFGHNPNDHSIRTQLAQEIHSEDSFPIPQELVGTHFRLGEGTPSLIKERYCSTNQQILRHSNGCLAFNKDHYSYDASKALYGLRRENTQWIGLIRKESWLYQEIFLQEPTEETQDIGGVIGGAPGGVIGGVIGGVLGAKEQDMVVQAGTLVYWPNGHPAGKVRIQHGFSQKHTYRLFGKVCLGLQEKPPKMDLQKMKKIKRKGKDKYSISLCYKNKDVQIR